MDHNSFEVPLISCHLAMASIEECLKVMEGSSPMFKYDEVRIVANHSTISILAVSLSAKTSNSSSAYFCHCIYS